MSRTFCLGDPHGDLRGLLQVLKLSDFDKEEDILICLGDVADGWPETAEVIEELLTIKNLIPILGNHDAWLKDYLEHPATVDIWAKYHSTYVQSPDYWLLVCKEAGITEDLWIENFLMKKKSPRLWLDQGGLVTYRNYQAHPELKVKHRDFYFPKCVLYYVDCNNNAYVHGGYKSKDGLGHETDDLDYMWDRNLWTKALSAKKNGLKMTKMYNKVFLGHTSLGYSLPQKRCNVWNLDTGGGWEGCLTLMNVETEEYFMSDRVKLLYPEVRGRD